MQVLLRSQTDCDVAIAQNTWEYCDLKKLDMHIRALQMARKWLAQEMQLRTVAVKGTKIAKEEK